MTNLKDIGEFGFIARFASQFDGFIKKGELGIGDDCAVIPINEEESYVVCTDLLTEGIHFLKDKITPQELGHKVLAVNLSDIAAMGAEPKYSFLSIGIPENSSVSYMDAFIEGFYALSEKYGIPLMGGDTTKTVDKLMINVMVIGQCKNSELRLRSMAQEGDLICVTGSLGDSAGGLQVLLNELDQSSDTDFLIKKHHLPNPRIEEGCFLSKQASVGAMIDISDGIPSDLLHILKASNKAAKVDIDALPISNQLQKVAQKYQWNAIDLATSGGEDYELLFTVRADDIERLKKEYLANFSEEITIIGAVKSGEPNIAWYKDGEKIKLNKSGFNHFTK